MIEITHATKIYKTGQEEIRALDDVSLRIDKGEMVAIVGQSGSGKTTLMNLLGCLDTPTRGTYFLDGREVTGMSPDKLAQLRRENLGFIFQSFNLLPHLTALENVELPLVYCAVEQEKRRELAKESLDAVGLSRWMHHKPFQLSGGQQQRVAIARAIVTDPPLLLADEPTGNLDSQTGRDILQTILMLNKKGRTVVMITHDSGIAKIARRRVKIENGRIAC